MGLTNDRRPCWFKCCFINSCYSAEMWTDPWIHHMWWFIVKHQHVARRKLHAADLNVIVMSHHPYYSWGSPEIPDLRLHPLLCFDDLFSLSLPDSCRKGQRAASLERRLSTFHSGRSWERVINLYVQVVNFLFYFFDIMTWKPLILILISHNLAVSAKLGVYWVSSSTAGRVNRCLLSHMCIYRQNMQSS